ncbi:Hypothetical protein, putative [Bodo saltans]|uniref:Uncharacterized protein n=1 Tax=Bodo saltans TaxID=75058 RepID=A0A0S4IVP9_BODSA|nr:Hypothetical protein, putative [Bodo saltans]|eukprot:CUG01679.1 Hypothetical protein, putative [Bodo saltans]
MKSAVWWGRTSTWTRWHWSTNGAAGQRIAFRCLPQKHASFDSLPHTVADTTLLDTVNRLLLPDRRRRLTAAEVRDLISQSSQPNLELEVAPGEGSLCADAESSWTHGIDIRWGSSQPMSESTAARSLLVYPNKLSLVTLSQMHHGKPNGTRVNVTFACRR